VFGAGGGSLAGHPRAAALLRRLAAVVARLQAKVGCEWLGLYQARPAAGGGWALIKLAYVGSASRADFPLTEAFAKKSSNSTVGMQNSARIIADTRPPAAAEGGGGGGEGPYYECDAKVRSELCLPITSADGGRLLGIIDCEAWSPAFFTEARTLDVLQVCLDFGRAGIAVDEE